MKKVAMLLWSLIAVSAILVSACATTRPPGNLAATVDVSNSGGNNAAGGVNLTL
jgi:predicted small secreted protein